MKKLFLLLILLIALWSFLIEPEIFSVNHVTIKDTQLKGLKVVLVSDLHAKTFQKKKLTKLIDKINEQKPDIILNTGDFVSAEYKSSSMPIEQIAPYLSKLKSKYGSYAVLGNHDWWVGGERIERVLEKNGTTVLGNENTYIKLNGKGVNDLTSAKESSQNSKKIYIVGVEDMTTRNINLAKALKGVSSPAILITHSPDLFPIITKPQNQKLTSKVNLVLAGHTHGGQVVFPFIGPVIVPSSYDKQFAYGFFEKKKQKMFVTRGIGTSILHVRFNCIPEIVVINFV